MAPRYALCSVQGANDRHARRRSAQRDPGIDQPVLVDEGVVVRVDGVEVARDDAAAAPGLAQEVGECFQLRGATLKSVAE